MNKLNDRNDLIFTTIIYVSPVSCVLNIQYFEKVKLSQGQYQLRQLI